MGADIQWYMDTGLLIPKAAKEGPPFAAAFSFYFRILDVGWQRIEASRIHRVSTTNRRFRV